MHRSFLGKQSRLPTRVSGFDVYQWCYKPSTTSTHNTMSARVRPSLTEPTQRRAGNEPPPYEKPSFPLNPAAQRALEQLTRTHKLNKLDSDLLEAQAALSTTAGDINDRLYKKE